jgi:hypothetical protein
MTLVVNRTQAGTPTHAFVLGVGEYPLINNLAEPDLRDLAPLPEATKSALALIQWLRSTAYDPVGGGLATLECLLSSPEGPVSCAGVNNQLVNVDPPTVTNIDTAFEAWSQRLQDNPGCVALFYFCGHGFMKNKSMLLTSDWGKHKLNPFKDTIDFNGFANGMLSCKAKTQLLFADACRQIPRTAAQQLDELTADPLWVAKTSNIETRNSVILQATLGGQKAWAANGQVTLFTQALLEGLSGTGSERRGGTWQVTTSGLERAVADGLARQLALPGTPQQFSEGRTEGDPHTVVNRLSGTPKVPVRIGCNPADKLQYTHFQLRLLATPANIFDERAPATTPWDLKLPADKYLLGADFPTEHHQADDLEIWALPPSCTEYLEVK